MKVLLAASLAAILLAFFAHAQPQTVSVRQCRCQEIDECSAEISAKLSVCKKNARCVEFLRKVGDEAKIRACLDAEQAEMQKSEECVRTKVGTVGCSKEENPSNLTIPLIPVIEAPEMFASDDGAVDEDATLAFHPNPPNGPPELGQYLMCVDQCSMTEAPRRRRLKRNPNCAFKLRCALAPPTEAVQKAFVDCQQELGIDPQKRFRESCECLRNAGLSAMQC